MRHIIMIVDDNTNLLDMFKDIFKLAIMRFPDSEVELLTFLSPIEALYYYENNCNDIGVVISDYQMPKMLGSAFYNILSLVDPDLKFILLTGLYRDFDVHDRSNLIGIYHKPLDGTFDFVSDLIKMLEEG